MADKTDEKRWAVKFCGHCNPQFSMLDLYTQIKKVMPEITFCFYGELEYPDKVLVFCACPAACVCPESCSIVVKVVANREDIDESIRISRLKQRVVSVVRTIEMQTGDATMQKNITIQ